MSWDWSEKWLQDAAGWRAVKEGKMLFQSGRVSTATCEGDFCRGEFRGEKPIRVSVHRISPSLAEVKCTCLENRRNGTFCEHAVAVALFACNKPPHSIKESPEVAANEMVTAFSLELPPNWKELAIKGRWSVRISPTQNIAGESDLRLAKWLRQEGLSDFSKSTVLALNSQTIVSFLDAAWKHPRLAFGDKTIVWSDSFDAPCETVKSEHKLGIHLVDQTSVWSPLRQSPFFLGDGEIVRISEQKTRSFFITLFSEKYSEIPASELVEYGSIIAYLEANDRNQWASQWRRKWVTVDLSVTVYGKLDSPQIRIKATVNGQIAPDKDGVLLSCDLDEIQYLELRKLQTCVSWLATMGWLRVGESDVWKPRDEGVVMGFWEGDSKKLAAMVDEYTEAPPIADALRQLVRVETDFRLNKQSQGGLALHVGFRSAAGKDFQAEKIMQLLRSGKRLIQTNDGTSLLLPKESWEAFQSLADQSGWKQNQGAFTIQKGEKRILQEFSKNKHKNTDEQCIIENSRVQKALENISNVCFRPYQKDGVAWLDDRLSDEGFALLADEMGLGKTLQSIALMGIYATTETPVLVVMPTSLLGNWQREIAKFNPSLKTYVHHGEKRDPNHWTGHSVIVTSYKILSLDRALFMQREFALVILDEASLIRNPDTDSSRACFRLRAHRRLALTGTPVENHMRDLWAIFHFLQPGYLGERKSFENRFAAGKFSVADQKALHWRTKPYILRRTKDKVAGDLPEKWEIDEWCELSEEQNEWYKGFCDSGLAVIDRCESDAQARMQMLTLILRLRQTCCDLALLDASLQEKLSNEQRSGKLVRLLEIIAESTENDQKVLVFSQFSRQLHLIQNALQEEKIPCLLLDGASNHRSELVESFQSPAGPKVFLVSLKAGGYGLNLTAASTVVLYEPWWNPAVERQAIDRAHRIGQNRQVRVYRFLTRNTMEERVKKFQENKNALATSLLDENPLTEQNALSMDEIRDIFRQSVSSAASG